MRSSERTTVHLGVRDSDGHEVILKCYGSSRAPVEREFNLLRRIEGPGVVRALGVELATDPPALVLERLRGVELNALAEPQGLDVATFLTISRQLADALTRIHGLGLIHRDIKPQNIIVSPTSLDTRIVDFESAVELGADHRSGAHPRMHTPLYMSPEQARSIGRSIDFRSDLYALGATFYHALTGAPPFPDSTRAKLVHAHLAIEPQPPHDVVPAIPVALSRIVLKLLQKEPEERYQTARALAHDLIECQHQLDAQGEIDPDLPLATADIATRPLILRKLYGREEEHALLEAALERTCCGRRELWFVRGAPGVGKSALVEGLRNDVLALGGYLAQGKFDLYRRDRQYYGWVGALASLLEQLLARGDTKNEDWAECLRMTLGSTAGALLEIAPDLKFLLDEIEPVPALGPAETQVRLGAALARLMEVVATPEHPLVLVLDDLQWADAGSVALLLELLRSERPASLLLLCTYRDNEEDARRAYAQLKKQLEAADIPALTIDLVPLGVEAVEQMLSEIFEREPDQVRALAGCVARKTDNNPFLIQQFLEHLRTLELIRYRPREGWVWDDAEVVAADIPDEAVELMLEKIARLTPYVREVLVFASFVGDEFDAELLRGLAHRELGAIEAAFLELSEVGMIAPCRAGYRFAHDRIREAAQSLLSERERASLHYNSANLLFGRASMAERRASAAELADQFNRALDLIQPEQRLPVLQLNLWAAERALAAGAAASASVYAEAAHTLLHAQSAHRILHPGEADLPAQLRFDLECVRARIRTMAGRHAEAEAILAPLDEHATTPAQLATAISLRVDILACVAREHGYDGPCAQRAIDIATAALRTLRAPYPANPSVLRALVQGVLGYLAVRRLRASELMHLAGCPDPRRAAIAQIEGSLSRLGYARPGRGLHFAGYVLRRLHQRWAGPNLPHALATVGVALGHVFHWNKAAERLASVALELIERGYPAALPYWTYTIAYYGVFAWTRPPGPCAAELERIIQPALEVGGDPLSASGASASVCRLRYDMGASLPMLLESTRSAIKLAKRANDFGFLSAFEYGVQGLERLSDPRPLSRDEPLRARSAYAWTENHRAWFWFVMSEYELASEALANVPDTDGFPTREPLMRGLASLICAERAEPKRRRELLRIFRRDRRTLRRWARRCPANFEHLPLILDAERARLAGRPERALRLGQAAEKRALASGYPYDAALARERYAHYLLDLNRDIEAASVVQKVLDFCEGWGAAAKVTHLRAQHAQLLGKSASRGGTDGRD